jgi:spermidine/putrescine transport system permease protein
MMWLGRVFLALVLVFLYAPIVVMMVMAFNASPLYQLPMEWSGRWFVALMDNRRLLSASGTSVGLALLTSLIATSLGTLAALAFARYTFRGRRLLQILLLPPIAIPWLIIGTSLLVFTFWIGLPRGWPALLIGHVALALPYTVILVGARLAVVGVELEDAARGLGAGPWQVLWRVTLPSLLPGIAAAAAFAFAVSFDQFVISYFLAAPGTSTLPVEIYSAIRKGFTPEINAISTLIILLSMALLLLVARLYRFGGSR